MVYMHGFPSMPCSDPNPPIIIDPLGQAPAHQPTSTAPKQALLSLRVRQG